LSNKPVGKKAEPTTEELEFIYGRLPKLSDQEILEEMQSEEFPLRSLGFIKRRRREFNTSKKVLQVELQREVDPVAAKRREEHFNHLAEIVDSMAPDKTTVIEVAGSGCVITESNGKRLKLTHEQLASSIKGFLEEAAKQYGHTDVYEYLLPHLEAEAAETEGKELNSFIKENPLEFYKTLRFLADKRIFKGECPVCRK
jgi:hypothetical protein